MTSRLRLDFHHIKVDFKKSEVIQPLVHADILPSLWVFGATGLLNYFFWSNIGLFNLIYKAVSLFILCKANQVT